MELAYNIYGSYNKDKMANINEMYFSALGSTNYFFCICIPRSNNLFTSTALLEECSLIYSFVPTTYYFLLEFVELTALIFLITCTDKLFINPNAVS